ncbi:MAG: DUF2066 domain-containing protein [Pseudomonadota bacterium]
MLNAVSVPTGCRPVGRFWLAQLTFGLLILIIVASLALGEARAEAQNSAVFAVPEVPVYAKAETAAAAQQKAQTQGRRRAMDLLLRRLTAEADWEYLPTLALGRAPNASGAIPELGFDVQYVAKVPVQLTAADLPQLEEGFAIFDEKTSGTTYRAKITYRFKPDGIRRILEAANLPYSEAQAREALIVPILETDEGLYLWETNNPWARAWLARPLINELTPLRLPVGDQQDVEAMTADGAKALNAAAFGQIARRYNAQQVILAHGRLRQANGEFRLQVRLIDAYLAGRPTDAAPVPTNPEDAAGLYDSADGFGKQAVAVVALREKGAVMAEAYFKGRGDDFPALAQRAVEATVAKYAREWKTQTLVDHSAIRPLSLTAWFGSLDEWAVIRIALEKSPLIREMKVGAFTNENALIDLNVIGQQNQFILAMRQANLSVWLGPDGGWNIASFDRSEQVQNRLATIAQEQNEQPRNGLFNRFGRREGVPLGAAPREDSIPTLPDDLFSSQPVELDQVIEEELNAQGEGQGGQP